MHVNDYNMTSNIRTVLRQINGIAILNNLQGNLEGNLEGTLKGTSTFELGEGKRFVPRLPLPFRTFHQLRPRVWSQKEPSDKTPYMGTVLA